MALIISKAFVRNDSQVSQVKYTLSCPLLFFILFEFCNEFHVDMSFFPFYLLSVTAQHIKTSILSHYKTYCLRRDMLFFFWFSKNRKVSKHYWCHLSPPKMCVVDKFLKICFSFICMIKVMENNDTDKTDFNERKTPFLFCIYMLKSFNNKIPYFMSSFFGQLSLIRKL